MSDHAEYACPTQGCHAIVCLLPELEERLRKTHETFYCPAGHTMSFTGRTPDQKKIDQLEAQVEKWRANWREQWDRAEEIRVRLRACPLCAVTFRSRSSLVRHLRDDIANGGHGAAEVDAELVETVAAANRRSWPVNA